MRILSVLHHGMHKAILLTKRALKGRKAGKTGVISLDRTLPHIEMRVTLAAQERAFQILDALFALIEDAGGKVVPGPDGKRMVILYEGEEIDFRMVETMDRINARSKNPPESLRPTGRFTIEVAGAFGSINWFDDRKDEPLEQQVHLIARCLPKMAKGCREERFKEKLIPWAVQGGKTSARKARYDFAIGRINFQKNLLRDARSWRRVNEISALLDAAERMHREKPPRGFKEWLAKSREQLDALDPLRRPQKPWQFLREGWE